MEITEITPIEKIGDMYFKRDDLFLPFNNNINGGKLRQCLILLNKNKDKIQNGIITCTSVLSPQGAIIAACAKYYNIKCIVCYGGTTYEKLFKHTYPKIASDLGAEVRIVAKTGRQSVLQKYVNDYKKENNLFAIEYGMDLKNNIDCFFDSTALQCQNISENITDIWISCGSAITICGVLYGLSIYPNNIQKIHAVGIAPNREEKIKEYCYLINEKYNTNIDLNKLDYIDAYNLYSGYKYENIKKIQYHNLKFHPRYEAKAFNYMIENNKINENSLFWIIGSDI